MLGVISSHLRVLRKPAQEGWPRLGVRVCSLSKAAAHRGSVHIENNHAADEESAPMKHSCVKHIMLRSQHEQCINKRESSKTSQDDGRIPGPQLAFPQCLGDTNEKGADTKYQ